MNSKLLPALAALLLCLFTQNIKGQNLVSNGDFELYSGCPASFSQIDSALGWTAPTSYVSTDYFNTCAPVSSLIGVPVNQGTGYQYPHSGNGYAGLFLYASIPDVREYLETELTMALTANQCYHFEMYINLLNGVKYTSDDIQVYFSDTLLSGIPGYGVLNYGAQIENLQGNFADTLNWTKVEMNYTASGGEKFLTIGNFKADSLTTLVQVSPLALSAVYVYIDDISLSLCTSLEETNATEGTTVITDNENMTLNLNNHSGKTLLCEIFDITSRKIAAFNFSHEYNFSISGLQNGIYIYRCSYDDQITATGKFLKH